MLLKAEKQYRIKDIMNCLPKFFLQFLLLVSCVFFLIFIWACLLELCFALVVGGVSLIFDGISVVLVHHRMLSSGEGACGDLCLFSCSQFEILSYEILGHVAYLINCSFKLFPGHLTYKAY